MLSQWYASYRKRSTFPLLVTAGSVLLAVAAIAMALTIVQLRTDSLEEARRNIANLALVLGEQTSRSVQTVDLVLRDLHDTIVETHADSIEIFDRAVGGDLIQRALKEKVVRLPQVDVFAIVDSHGRLANASRNADIGMNLSDRDYFQHFNSNDDAGLFVSAPIQTRATGTWTIYFARRINSSRGEFLGIVVGGVAIRYFEDIYKSIDLPRKESFLLVRRDGTVLVRHPDLSRRAGQVIPATSPWHALVAHGGGYYESPGYFDQAPRMVAVRPLHDFPLVVNAAVAEDEVLVTWRKRAFYMGVGSLLVLAYAMILMNVTHRQFRRLREFSASLRQQNETLKLLSDELTSSEASLAARGQELETTLETMDQGLMMADRAGTIVQCNRQAMHLLDLPPELMAAHPTFSAVLEYQWNENRSGREEGSFEEFARKRMANDRPYVQELNRPDGRVIEMRSIPIVAGGFVRTYTDITVRKAADERVHYLAHHDDLTRLVNRVAFRERLQEALGMARTSRRGTALLYLDLDRFKEVNDTRGHDVGDRVLAEAAQRMRACVRAVDTVARLGGDEFAIILPFLDDRNAAENLAQRLLRTLAEPFVFDDVPSSIGVSIGIAICPDDGISVDDLLQHADGALYNAKRAGRNTFRFHAVSEGLREASA